MVKLIINVKIEGNDPNTTLNSWEGFIELPVPDGSSPQDPQTFGRMTADALCMLGGWKLVDTERPQNRIIAIAQLMHLLGKLANSFRNAFETRSNESLEGIDTIVIGFPRDGIGIAQTHEIRMR